MNVSVQDAFAKVALNKSLLKEYSTQNFPRLVYLNNGTEFQIQIYNSTFKTFATKIFINGESDGDMLVIRPAERVWLERYLRTSKKFLFETYEMDNTGQNREIEKMAHNGEIKIEFYSIREKSNSITYISSPYSVYYSGVGTNIEIETNASTTLSDQSLCTKDFDCNVSYTCTGSVNLADSIYEPLKAASASIETGQISKGSHSNQKLSYVDMDFESYPFKTEIINILPSSRKTIESDDLKKKYCSNCGRKLSPKHKFCPYCGTKVD